MIGALLAFPLFLAVGLWVVYRVVRGWAALRDGKAVYAVSISPGSWLRRIARFCKIPGCREP